MRQILHAVILTSQRGESGRREGRVGFLQHGQDRRRVDGDRQQFGEAVIGEELHLLQARSGVGGGGGTGAGVERVRL